MKPSSDSPSSKPSLEALLRLKREERPDAVFWSDFEVRLRQKQLAAIIEPKPWWLGASLAFRRFSLLTLVVATGAAAMFALVAVRNSVPVMGPGLAAVPVSPAGKSAIDGADIMATVPLLAPASDAFPAADAIEQIAESESVLMASLVESALPSSSSLLVSSVPAFTEIVAATSSSGNSDDVIGTVADAASVMGGMGAVDVSAAAITAAASESGLAVNTFLTPEGSFELSSRDFTSVLWMPDRVILHEDGLSRVATTADADAFAFGAVVPDQAAETVLSDAVVPAPNSRFERLLSADTPKVIASSGAFAQVRDRVLHHLGSDEELYASVSRVGVGGDRLSLRF